MSDEIYYDSWKENRDIILEYNQVSLDDTNIVNILGLAVDNLTRDQSIVKVMSMIDSRGLYHIIFLNPYKIIKIRFNSDLMLIYNKASMYLSSGAGLRWASRMLNSGIRERIPILSFMMDLIRIAEMKEYTIFLVGGKPDIVERAFFNIRKSFPKIRIVGRHGGFFTKSREEAIIEAIQKSEPDIIFVGLGFPKEEHWIYKLKSELKHGVIIGVGGSLDIISGEIKKAPAFFMTRGLDWFYRIVLRPWRLGRLFLVMFFFIGILFKKIFKRY
ncbi:MAG: WecB/TagA/CpsF family glycosyltransferase [Spirochaetes bacterium]|nr:WecB/TagA/CpsF family glycosyltransferase [Spirochaetota bacterium]